MSSKSKQNNISGEWAITTSKNRQPLCLFQTFEKGKPDIFVYTDRIKRKNVKAVSRGKTRKLGPLPSIQNRTRGKHVFVLRIQSAAVSNSYSRGVKRFRAGHSASRVERRPHNVERQVRYQDTAVYDTREVSEANLGCCEVQGSKGIYNISGEWAITTSKSRQLLCLLQTL